MPAPDEEIIRYDGRTLTVGVRALIQVEACRGRRWGWFGRKGWWVHLYLFHGWHIKRFVLTLVEAGVFLKHDPDYLPWIEEEAGQSASTSPEQTSSALPLWKGGAPFLPF